ncbi:MAG: hypothetical protein AAGH60_03765 [Pseudomonadota bacterium]
MATHEIRTKLSDQVLRLWMTEPNLRSWDVGYSTWGVEAPGKDQPRGLAREVFPLAFQRNGQSYGPLIPKRMKISCEVSINLFTVHTDEDLLSKGDIDNKLKRLVDALRIPTENVHPKPSDEPIFTVMEDDSQVTRLSVEHTKLFTDPRGQLGQIAQIKVRTKPIAMLVDNSMFW